MRQVPIKTTSVIVEISGLKEGKLKVKFRGILLIHSS